MSYITISRLLVKNPFVFVLLSPQYQCLVLIWYLCQTRYKDNLKLDDEDKYEFAYDQHTCAASVYVKGVVKSDDGSYKCRVENAFGVNSQTCEVCVELKSR